MKLSLDKARFFEANGYLLLKNYFSLEEIEQINSEIPRLLMEDTPRRILEKTGTVRSIFAPEQSSKVFEQLISLKKLVKPMEQLLNDKVYLHQSKLNIKAALGGEWWQWHQDYLYWQKEDGMPSDNVISMAIYLDDVTEFNGPLLLIPNSHNEIIKTELNTTTNLESVEESTLSANLKYLINKENLQSIVEKSGGIVSSVAPKGSVLLFHGSTLHASSSNLSPYDRKMMFLSYNSVQNHLNDIDNPRPNYVANRNFQSIEATSNESLFAIKDMKKIGTDFIISQYQSGIENYSDFTTQIGLWESEKFVFQKYLNKTDEILDVGCGTGRTTFHLYKLGYEKILGLDLTPEMIYRAKELNQFYGTNIHFETGDATQLKYNDSRFDAVIFSFNGLMTIPNSINRIQAIQQINRILKPNGIFIFTTNDREENANFFEFWKEEKQKWKEGKQNIELYEFGDIILANSKNENQEIFVHIPNQEEIKQLIELGGFELIETFYRSDKFNESLQVKEKSGECRFWITKKKTQHTNK